jgi:hypothetical protein
VAYIVEQFADQVDENRRRLMVRNGYHHERDALNAAGTVTVVDRRVNDTRVDPDSIAHQRLSLTILLV